MRLPDDDHPRNPGACDLGRLGPRDGGPLCGSFSNSLAAPGPAPPNPLCPPREAPRFVPRAVTLARCSRMPNLSVNRLWRRHHTLSVGLLITAVAVLAILVFIK